MMCDEGWPYLFSDRVSGRGKRMDQGTEEMRHFTQRELKKFDGRDGRPAYIEPGLTFREAA
jgi:hypothetical protein